MKIGFRKTNTGSNLFVNIPKEQAILAEIQKGDEVSVQTNGKKEIVIKKIKTES